jgi:hypothetical protein
VFGIGGHFFAAEMVRRGSEQENAGSLAPAKEEESPHKQNGKGEF